MSLLQVSPKTVNSCTLNTLMVIHLVLKYRVSMWLVTCVFWHSVNAAVAFLMAPVHKPTWLRHNIEIPFWFSGFCKTTSSVDAVNKKNTDIYSIFSFKRKVFNDRRKWLNSSDATSDAKQELHVYI
jgi:hypothetical protein